MMGPNISLESAMPTFQRIVCPWNALVHTVVAVPLRYFEESPPTWSTSLRSAYIRVLKVIQYACCFLRKEICSGQCFKRILHVTGRDKRQCGQHPDSEGEFGVIGVLLL